MNKAMNICDKETFRNITDNINNRCALTVLTIVREFQQKIDLDSYQSLDKTLGFLQTILASPDIINIYVDANTDEVAQEKLAQIAAEGIEEALRGLEKYASDKNKELYIRINKLLSTSTRKVIPLKNGGKRKSGVISDKKDIKSPRDIIMAMKEVVKGQDECLENLAISAYEYLNIPRGIPANLSYFLVGPSGCGKSMIAESLAEACHLPRLLINCQGITEEGIKGENTSDIVEKIERFAHKNPKGIIVLDETDKIIAPDYDSHSCNRSEKIQGQLMALLSPGVPLGNGRNTNQYMYIMTGAFSNLRSNRKHVEKEIGFGKNITPRREQKDDELTIEALKEYGMMPEFARRVTGIFTIKALSRDSLYDIAMLQTSMFMSRTRRVKDIYGIEVDIETMSKLAIDEAFQVSGSEEGLFNRAYSIFDREVNKIVLERFKG